ncbi:MAG: hypothetical protein AAGF97_06600, partial [Planctomycetota bacterium]
MTLPLLLVTALLIWPGAGVHVGINVVTVPRTTAPPAAGSTVADHWTPTASVSWSRLPATTRTTGGVSAQVTYDDQVHPDENLLQRIAPTQPPTAPQSPPVTALEESTILAPDASPPPARPAEPVPSMQVPTTSLPTTSLPTGPVPTTSPGDFGFDKDQPPHAEENLLFGPRGPGNHTAPAPPAGPAATAAPQVAPPAQPERLPTPPPTSASQPQALPPHTPLQGPPSHTAPVPPPSRPLQVVTPGNLPGAPHGAMKKPTVPPGVDPHAECFAETMFPSAKKCLPCHEQIYEEWASSSHAYAAISPMFQK